MCEGGSGLPVYNRQASHPSELVDIARDYGRPEAQGLGGDEGVEGAYALSAGFKLTAERGVVVGVLASKRLDGSSGG